MTLQSWIGSFLIGRTFLCWVFSLRNDLLSRNVIHSSLKGRKDMIIRNGYSLKGGLKVGHYCSEVSVVSYKGCHLLFCSISAVK